MLLLPQHAAASPHLHIEEFLLPFHKQKKHKVQYKITLHFQLLPLFFDKIKASFVFTEYNGKIYISARSIDEVNVQLVMEKLGGGGL